MPVSRIPHGCRQPMPGNAARTAALAQHLLVIFVAAGRKHHALRAVVLFVRLAALHDHARHGARIVGHQLHRRRLVPNLRTGIGDEACEDLRQIGRSIRKIQRRIPRPAV